MTDYENALQKWLEENCPHRFDCAAMMGQSGLIAKDCENYSECRKLFTRGVFPVRQVERAYFNLELYRRRQLKLELQ